MAAGLRCRGGGFWSTGFQQHEANQGTCKEKILKFHFHS
jgi:hypothetical protein